MIKESILQETIIINMYVPFNTSVKLCEAKPDGTARRDPWSCYQSWRLQYPSVRNGQIQRQQISRDLMELNTTSNQQDGKDIYRLLHPMTAECAFLSSSYGTFRTDDILGHKIHPNKCKRTQIMQCLLSDHSEIKLGSIAGRSPNNWRLNNLLLNNTGLKKQKQNEKTINQKNICKMYSKGLISSIYRE